MEDGNLQGWAEAVLDWHKSQEGGPIGKQLQEVDRNSQQARIKKFLNQFWPARSKNKKG